MISGGHHAGLRFVRNGCRSSADYFHHPRTMNLKLWARAEMRVQIRLDSCFPHAKVIAC